jgi:hypothetical protein
MNSGAHPGPETTTVVDHKGLPIAGYRPQNDDAVTLVNDNKQAEEKLLRLMDSLAHDYLPGVEADKRWLAIARTQIEQGFMALNRSIFKPGRVELPDPFEV